MSKQHISSGSPYEPRLGISRAVRSGRLIAVAGTAPIGADGNTVGIGDPSAQARRCIEIIRNALEEAGASLSDVIRTRILLTRIEDWERVGLVHGEYFGTIRPANTVMQVTSFIDPDWLVEIEADAVIDD
jgi:enamine deaminase RidA (YjgF/YER057c/UK114 family)